MSRWDEMKVQEEEAIFHEAFVEMSEAFNREVSNMRIGDIVKVFSNTSEYDGQTGRIVLIGSAPGAPAPFVVQFGDAITEPFSEREIVPMKPIESLWLESPLETHHARHGASSAAQMYIGRIIAQKFIHSERRRMALK